MWRENSNALIPRSKVSAASERNSSAMAILSFGFIIMDCASIRNIRKRKWNLLKTRLPQVKAGKHVTSGQLLTL